MVEPRSRLVLLGASNVSRSLPDLVAGARVVLRGPVQVIAAHGHGRSFGVQTRIVSRLLRELPSIGESAIWGALATLPAPEASHAVVADVGNDLAYGFDAATIAGWVERDLERLRASGARLALVRLPIATLEATPAWRFRLAATLLFPGRPIDRARVLDAARDLDDRLVRLARASGARLVDHDPSWHGIDPIHVRGAARPAASAAWLGLATPLAPAARLDAPDLRELRRARPAERRFLGRATRQEQPSARLADGTTVSWY